MPEPHNAGLLLAKLAAIRKEVSESDLSPEHKDTLQAKVDEAVRLLDMPEAAVHADLVAAVQELKGALADRIGYEVRSEVRSNARMRLAIYGAVHEAVAAALEDALKRHREDCALASAERHVAARESGKAAELAALAGVPWPAILKQSAMLAPRAFFATAALVVCYLIVHGFGDRLLALLVGGG